MDISDLIQFAKAMSHDQRKDILMSIPELELHYDLKELFSSMEPSYTIEVTQGTKELGKDLVLVKQDNLTTDVIGVVVKCGDIKAKTLGEVDVITGEVNSFLSKTLERKTSEIESQIRQAFAHEAELVEFFRTLPVNKVKVIIAGEISNQARIRLEKEIHGPVEVEGIDWLISNFTNFYPQVFFEGQVTSFVQRKVQELETRHRVVRSKKILSECFVEPVVRASDINPDFGEELRALVSRKELPFSRLKPLLSQHRRIIMVGDPGTGKSAALAKLTIDLFKEVYKNATRAQGKRKKTLIPVLVKAKDILNTSDLDQLLLEYVGESEVVLRVETKVLIVDGLDEVASSKRNEVIEKAKSYAEELKCALLIASRKVDLLSITPAGFDKYELLPFGAGQALQLIEKLHSSKDVLGTLRESLENVRYQIPMVPLSLILLIELVEEQGEIPASVSELYDRYSDSVLGRFDKDKGIEVLFEYLIKKRFLASLAFNEFSSKGLIEITRQDFDAFCHRYAGVYGLESTIDKFVQDVLRAGVIEVGEETVLFTHRSFLDYFSAYHIFSKRDEFENLNDFIRNIYFDDLWGETTFFYVGQKREISQKLLDYILDYDRDSLWVNSSKMMVGRLLQAGWYSETTVKYNGIKKALSFIPSVRERFYAIAERGKWPEPKIVVDLLLLSSSNYSLRSGFISAELRQLYDELVASEETKNLPSLIFLLSVMKPFLTHEEFREEAQKLLRITAERSELAPDEKVRATMLLTVIKGTDKVLSKALKRRLIRLRDQFPSEFRSLLPPSKTKQRFEPPKRKR
ncbi:MAG: hypothetical protein LC795_11420 [Acidobacteria bacterium]|nr:hypothetical protein [Acidobacteriota bacterium]